VKGATEVIPESSGRKRGREGEEHEDGRKQSARVEQRQSLMGIREEGVEIADMKILERGTARRTASGGCPTRLESMRKVARRITWKNKEI